MMKRIARRGVLAGLVVASLVGGPVAWADVGPSAPVAVPVDSSAPVAAAVPAAERPAAVPAAPASPATDARKACTDAMNANPEFAASIVKIADEKAATKRDEDTIKAHSDANAHIQKNEKHVIYAYAALWIVAALFVLFLWRRQQTLVAEIASLRRDLEAAADDVPKGTA